MIEEGEAYEHAIHGEVEVAGIWNGVERVDRVDHTTEEDTIVVRYSAALDGEQADELTETLDDFLHAIESATG